MARVRYRRRYGPSDITLKYLAWLWKRQGGRCPFTGWKLRLPASTRGWDEKHPMNASLDRIDCSRGYVKGNVRFVAVMANLARQEFTDKDVRDFCLAVANFSDV